MQKIISRRAALLPVLAAALLTLLFFYKLAFSDHILGRGDTYTYFYPYWAARDAALLNSQLPLWTPDIFTGAPLLADPQLGTFYPPNWLTLGLAPPDAIRISILLHIVWALLGAYALARRTLNVEVLPALLAGAIFALSGYVGSHVEQINQLQGVAWMPWLFLLLHRASLRPARAVPLLGIAFALQLLTGHTQTSFISGVGLGVYALFLKTPTAEDQSVEEGFSPSPTEKFSLRFFAPSRLKSFVLSPALRFNFFALFCGVIIGAVLAAPQLIPTFELTAVSNRAGGLNQQQAVAFSFNPLLVGRGLLPSYDAQIVGEYVGYIGVIGLALAVWGLFAARGRQKWLWLLLALIGVTFAFGLYNPLYWLLASLPGFNWFRVPARWLVLFTLGGAMLAALGLQALVSDKRPGLRALIAVSASIGALALLSAFADRAPENVTDPPTPTPTTYLLWGAAFVVSLILLLANRYSAPRRLLSMLSISALALVAVVIELFLAAFALPYNTLVPPEVYHGSRFALDQLAVYTQDDRPPGRTLSITELLFDPGDKASLERRYQAMGLSDLAIRHALVAAKLKESLAPNLPLVWGLPSVDGFGGGLVPTVYYTQFTALLLPEGELRSVDGRLRENLALEACRGACIPDDRWLDLMGVQYLIIDKTNDLNYDSIFYDTAFRVEIAAGETAVIDDLPDFETTRIDLLYTEVPAALTITLRYADGERETLTLTPAVTTLDELSLSRMTLQQPRLPIEISLTSETPITIHALTLVDARTGSFAQVTVNNGWRRVLSSDIKLYENQDVLPRAHVLHDLQFVPDSFEGTESALGIMRGANFDPARTAVLSGIGENVLDPAPNTSSATITDYTAERVTVEVRAERTGYLLLTDSYFPGWRATVNGDATPILRTDVMFRAVAVPAGESTVVFTYAPSWYPSVLIVGAGLWIAMLALTAALWRRAPV